MENNNRQQALESMLKAMNPTGDAFAIRQDHLKAMIDYCLLQATTSNIDILESADNAVGIDQTKNWLIGYAEAINKVDNDMYVLVQEDIYIDKAFAKSELMPNTTPGNNCVGLIPPGCVKLEPLTDEIAPVSSKVLKVMLDCIQDREIATGKPCAAAPNIIQELVYEAIVDDVEPGCIAEDIANAAEQLASTLVGNPPNYL